MFNLKMHYTKKVLLAVMMISFVGPFMGSSVTVAVPQMAYDFGMNPEEFTWVVTAFLIGSVVGLLPFGRLSDMKGRKRVFIWGLVGNTVCTFLCALTTSYHILIVLRFLQGLSMSMVFGTSMALLVSCYDKSKRGQIIGYAASSVYTGISFGPVIGGFITDYLGWRYIFWITGAALAFNYLIIYKVKQEWYGNRVYKFDYIGSFLYMMMTFLFLYGVSDWTRDTYVHYFPVISLVIFIIFLIQQYKSSAPLIDLRIFANLAYSLSNLASLIHYSATFAIGFLISLYLQVIRGMDAFSAGLILLIQPLLMALVSPKAGSLSDRFSPSNIASIGMGCMVVGLYIFSYLAENTALYLIIGNLILIGIGFGLFSSPNTNAVMSSVNKEFFGIASSVLAIMRLVGQAMSMALVTLILSIYSENIKAMNYHDGLLEAFHIAFLVFTGLCILALLASLVRGKKSQQ